MKVDQIISTTRGAMTVRRVFGEPYSQDGTTIIAAAQIAGGAGGGGGPNAQGQEGEGAGFGLRARPVGVYTIKNGVVRWLPAVDANRAIAVLGAVIITWLIRRTRIPN